MPRNGSGTYNLPSGNPVVTQTLITSNWANTTMTDLATAITQSLARDGQTVPTAHLPMGGFRHTGAADPQDRQDYNTLGFAQDGKHTRITSVAGVNQITGNLPGSPTALVNGMLLQVIPANTNTGAVTLNINAIGFKPVVTSAGSDLAAGNLKAGKPYLLSYDGAVFIVVAGDLGTFAQSAMSGWDRPISGAYPSLTVVSGTTVGIPSGSGRIIAPGSKDASGVTEVVWIAQNLVLTGMAAAWSTQIGVDKNGVVQQFPGGFVPTYARDYVMLGTATHINGTLTGVITRPAIYGDMSYASYDIAALLQNTITAGGQITGGGANPFHLNVAAGSLFAIGSDFNEPTSPNIFEFPDQLDIQFFPITAINGVGAITQNAPITNYDPNGAGVVTAIPGPSATTSIHRLYFLSGQFLFLYGQNTYTDLNEALSLIQVDSADTIYPSKLGTATLLGYVIAQKDCLNLNDTTKARLISKGGAEFTLGGAGSISDAPIDGMTYGRKNAAWVVATPEPRGPAVTNRFIFYYTNLLSRWSEGANDTPEAGANAGSDWELRAYNDAGTLLGAAMKVVRSTLKATYYKDLTVETPSLTAFYLNATGNAADSRKARFMMDASGNAMIQTTTDADAAKSTIRLPATGGVDLINAGVTLLAVTPTRISADFSNATVANRMMFQSATTNGVTSVGAIPNGTATTSIYNVFNAADPNNAGTLQLRMDAALAILNSTKTGSGTTRDLALQFDNTDFFRFTTGFRMQADFSNATISSRWAFQTSTVNGATVVNNVPNGTGTTASYRVFNSSDPNNAGFLGLTMGNLLATIESSKNGSGVTRPLVFTFDGTEKMRLDSAGVLTLAGLLSITGASAGVQYFGRTSGVAEWVQYSDANLLKFFHSGADRVYLDSSGGVNAQGTVNSGITSNLQITGSTSGTHVRFRNDGFFSIDGGTTFLEIGYRDIPRVTGGLERGNSFATSAGLTVNTGPAAGSTYSVYNDSGSNITLTQGGGLTMRLGGTATTGSRTLAARGFATIWFNSTTECIVTGNVS